MRTNQRLKKTKKTNNERFPLKLMCIKLPLQFNNRYSYYYLHSDVSGNS